MLQALIAVVLLLAQPLQAEIYKCSIDGETVFSDSPCSEQAETVIIDIQRPDQQTIEKQQSITATFEEESRFNQIRQLNQRNYELEAEIITLQQQREDELALLRQKTDTLEDGRMATREHGLFEQMDRVEAQYQQKIERAREAIRRNQARLQTLYQQAHDDSPAESE